MMSPKEYAELLDYINEKHGWKELWDNTVEKHRKVIKYVDCCCDTRDGKIWIIKIKFRDISNSPLPNDNEYNNICFTEDRCTVENIKKWLNNYENIEVNDNDES